MADEISNKFFILLVVLTILVSIVGTFVFLDDILTPTNDNKGSGVATGQVSIEILPQEGESENYEES